MDMDFPTLAAAIGGGIIGLLVGSTATWALKVGQELKAYKAKEVATAEKEVAKLKLDAETDIQRVKVTAQEIGKFFSNLKAEFEAEKAKILNEADAKAAAQASTPAATTPAQASAAPAAAPAAATT